MSKDLILPRHMYLPRKTFDFGAEMITSSRVNKLAERLMLARDFTNVTCRDEEMDWYWAREHAAFILHCKKKGSQYYEFLPGRWFTYRRLADIIEAMGDIRGKRICELGCGSGICLIILAQDGALVEGLDVSLTSLAFLQDLAKYHRVNVTAKQRSFLETDYSDNSFYATFNLGSSEHMPPQEQRKLLHEMKRISNNFVIVSSPNLDSPLYRTMEEKEFSTLPLEYVFPREYIHYPVDLGQLVLEAGLTLVDEGAIHTAPSSMIPAKHMSDSCYRFFRELERFPQMDTKGVIDNWLRIERSLPKAILMKHAWFRYVIGKKDTTS